MNTKGLVAAALMAALAVLFQLSPFWPTTWGMRIDLVAVPWLIALFIYGMWSGLLATIATTVFIGFFAPTSWLGAVMKFTATLPLLIFLGIVIMQRYKGMKKHKMFFLAFVMAVLVRCVAMYFMNYYYALPIWLSMTTAELKQKFPVYVIILPNIGQSIVEFGLAWLIVFRTKLKKRAL